MTFYMSTVMIFYTEALYNRTDPRCTQLFLKVECSRYHLIKFTLSIFKLATSSSSTPELDSLVSDHASNSNIAELQGSSENRLAYASSYLRCCCSLCFGAK